MYLLIRSQFEDVEAFDGIHAVICKYFVNKSCDKKIPIDK
jgi:hypothetical protein